MQSIDGNTAQITTIRPTETRDHLAHIPVVVVALRNGSVGNRHGGRQKGRGRGWVGWGWRDGG